MEVVTIDQSDSEVEYSLECDSNLRSGGLVSSSSYGQEHGDCNESCKEFDEGNDENQGCLKDHGEDLMRYISHHQAQLCNICINMKKPHNYMSDQVLNLYVCMYVCF